MFILGSLESSQYFLSVLVELFSLGVTAEALRANINGKSTFLLEQGQFGLKFQVQDVVPHQPFFLPENRVTSD